MDRKEQTLIDIQENMHEINLSLQKLTLIQERQADDLENHIKRTNLLEAHVLDLEKAHLTCPAIQNATTAKTLITWIKDITAIIGLIVLIIKAFHLLGQ